jgi:FAD/FMN-containing dehydrogenase
VTRVHGTEGVVGAVIVPGDARYGATASIYNRLYRSKPALVVRPVDARDDARVLALAKGDGYEVGVKGGGHSIAGYGAIGGGLLIDLSGLDGIDLVPRGWVGW